MMAPVAGPVWERQDSDTDESWQAFVCYRDQRPPRKIRRIVVGGVKVSEAQAAAMLRRHNWRERAAAYDKHLDEIYREEYETILRDDVKAVAARHRTILQDMCELAEDQMQKLLAASKDNEMHGLVKPGELTKLVETVVKLDRLVREQSTDTVRHDFSTTDLADLKELEEKIRKRGDKS